MNYKRAVYFALFLYVVFLVLIMGMQALTGSFVMGLREYIGMWILSIPVVLVLAKWYFKLDAPTTKKGFMLGIIALVVGAILDLLIIGISAPRVGMTFSEMYKIFYTDWRFYVAVVEILALCTFAGFEFDGTYTKKPRVI